jgi:hypothetical protein
VPIAALSVLALALAHVFDYTTFLVMTSRHGIAAEANPVVVFVAHDWGLPGVTIAKIASVACLAIAIAACARIQKGRVAAALVVLGIVAGIFGGVSNILSI